MSKKVKKKLGHGGQRSGAGRPKGDGYCKISIHLTKLQNEKMRQLTLKPKVIFLKGIEYYQEENDKMENNNIIRMINISQKEPKIGQACLCVKGVVTCSQSESLLSGYKVGTYKSDGYFIDYFDNYSQYEKQTFKADYYIPLADIELITEVNQ